MATLSNRKIGTLTLDITTTEDHESALRVTDNPIESGAVISDHAVLDPKQITIEGMLVGYEPPSSSFSSSSATAIRTPDFVNRAGFPMPNLFTEATLAKMAKLSTVPSNNIRAIGGGNTDSFSSAGFGSEINSRIAKIQADFEKLQGSGETIEINTGTRLYKNMLITLFGVMQSTDGGVTVRITAREIKIVETSSTGALAGLKKSGRTAIQAASTTVRGEVNLKEVEKKVSFARGRIGYGIGDKK